MLVSFDLASGQERKVAYVTVRQAEPGAVGHVPPRTVCLGLLLLVVLATPIG